ncbi:NrdH-redoxin [Candidatus Woesearchaeota archaeon]|nr:NrdH-redoxin [Candidatus Woesearchaeota archaeon]
MAEVIVYEAPNCPWCDKVKQFLKENKIKFKAINVAENQKAAREMVQKSGQMGVPVTDIDGKIIVGFNEPKIKKLLKIK